MKINILGKLLKKPMAQYHEKYYSSRSELNRDLWKLISINDNFKEDILKIREGLSIPKLEAEDDSTFIGLRKEVVMESDWLESQSKIISKKFKKCVNQLIVKYKLPFYSEEFLITYILYRRPFSEAPKSWLTYAPELATSHNDELYRNPPTTQEKRLIKDYFRQLFKIKGKPDKKHARAYSKILKVLKRFKNTKRKIRTMNTAIKAIKKPKKYNDFDWTKGATGEKVVEKYTYRKLATEIYQTDKEKDLIKQVNTLKKQKQRLLGKIK